MNRSVPYFRRTWRHRKCRYGRHCRIQCCLFYHDDSEKREADVLVRDGYKHPVCYKEHDSHKGLRCPCSMLHPTMEETIEARTTVAEWYHKNSCGVEHIQGALLRTRLRCHTLSECIERMATDVTAIQAQLESEKDKRLCVICKDAERNFLFYGCNHLCICTNCHETMRANASKRNESVQCPMCRSVPPQGIGGVYY